MLGQAETETEMAMTRQWYFWSCSHLSALSYSRDGAGPEPTVHEGGETSGMSADPASFGGRETQGV